MYTSSSSAANVVAEGRHHGIVVRPAPFAEQIRQPVDQSVRAGLPAIGEQQLFRRFLGLSIGASGVSPGQTGLNGGGQQHRAAVPIFPEQLQQHPGKTGIAGSKFFRVPGAVHARQMNDEIDPRTKVGQRFWRSLPRAQEYFVDLQIRPGFVHAVADRKKPLRQIFSDKSVRAGDQHMHQQIPPNSFSFRSSCFISSTFSRRVLWEVYCSIFPSSGLPLLK